MKTYTYIMLVLVMSLAQATPAMAQEDSETDLAKKLANPIANLISMPFQYNYDDNFGVNDEGSMSKLNIQPVIPFSLNDEWNVITRIIVPLVDQHDIPAGKDKSGLSDTLASQFFSPKAPTASGWIWGVGPVEMIPTASDEMLGGEKWGLGPTAVVLKQKGPWTVGCLTNHVWSIAGDEDRSDVSATFIQPFLSYITKTKTTLGVNTESTYDWQIDHWSVPINATVGQLLKIGPQIFQITVGARYWAMTPDSGPEGWGARMQLTLLFPK